MPQAPQLLTSVAVLVHAPLQRVWPDGQTQAPPEQDCPAGHLFPQAPQWLASLCRFTQAVPHRVWAHVVAQLPFEQVSPLAQVRPHAPQFLGSVWVFTQVPPQLVCPVGQVGVQVPETQLSPEAHFLPQPPQWLVLVEVFTHWPPQSVCPEPQEITHAPSAQTWLEPQLVPFGLLTQAHWLLDVQVLQAPEQGCAQHRPPRHEPDWHSRPSPHSAPAGFFVHEPFEQNIPSPHAVPLGLFAQAQPVSLLQVLHEPEQAVWQHRPPTQAPDVQSSPATQLPPGGCLAGGVQRPDAHTSPAGQAAVLGWQAPAAVQVYVLSASEAAQVGVRHVVPAASRWHPPWPLHPLVHASCLQVPVGSAPPAGTARQVPTDPSRLQAMQVPLQADEQQRPCAQIPGAAQSSLRLQTEPMGRLPQELFSQTLPATHWASLWQYVAQRLPLQPRKGAHERGAGL